MSREIKFRVWNGDELTTIESRYFFEENGVHSVDSDGCASGFFGSFHFMQFTGLKDKNGVEIYEGDISPYLECSRQGKINAQAYYCAESAQFRVKWIDGEAENFDTLFNCNEWFEVIGNAHQNPELIK